MPHGSTNWLERETSPSVTRLAGQGARPQLPVPHTPSPFIITGSRRGDPQVPRASQTLPPCCDRLSPVHHRQEENRSTTSSQQCHHHHHHHHHHQHHRRRYHRIIINQVGKLINIIFHIILNNYVMKGLMSLSDNHQTIPLPFN
ncbi:palmitoyltransferase ZDHHC5-A-like isoform X1 [Rana temporaria]|uniref:palmitoyltransferase ZDHHC5-A-like isoform X1 n=1 Tax=Rana temporaria TaxID=8407 RepID=UPI001AACE10E|nr:palmitoyltransferase ZDHHC5-A-like isoform X1 [Rana temporaria]